MSFAVLRKIKELPFMVRDFFRVMSGSDYFHYREKLGNFFIDGKSYYMDFLPKVDWTGEYREGVPVLYVPSIGESQFFPSMVLQYGMGSIDSYFATGRPELLDKVKAVKDWLMAHIGADSYYDNKFSVLDPGTPYFSENSAMTQAEALSFLSRCLQFSLVDGDKILIEALMKRIFANIILPLEKGGGTLYRNDGVYLCEYCRKDDYVVLNGWGFALFGIIDYQRYFGDRESEEFLTRSLKTLGSDIETSMINGGGWSYYDNKKRVCSPPYQELHIHMMDALARLTGIQKFHEISKRMKEAFTGGNRLKYTLIKIKEKLLDNYRYTTT